MTDADAHEPTQDEARPKHRIFISYAREDANTAARLKRLCNLAGINAWSETLDIEAGELWRSRIEEVISESDIFVILVSGALKSDETKPWEWSSICEHSWKNPNVRLIPIRLEAVDSPSFLRRVHHLDAWDLTGLTRCVSEILRISNSIGCAEGNQEPVSKVEPDTSERFRELLSAVESTEPFPPRSSVPESRR